MENDFFSYGVWAFGVAFWLLFVRGLLITMKNSARKRTSIAKATVLKAKELQNNLRQHLAVLAQHEVEYFQTLMAVGYPELKIIDDMLQFSIDKVEGLIEAGDLVDATLIANWLIDQSARPPLLAVIPRDVQEALIDWRDRAQEVIIACTEEISEIARQNVDLGIKRAQRNRRPTLLNMQELRRWVGRH